MNMDRNQIFLNALSYFIKEKNISYYGTRRKNVKFINIGGFRLFLIYSGPGLKWYIKNKTKTSFLPAYTENDYYNAIQTAYKNTLLMIQTNTNLEIISNMNRNFYDDPDYNIPDECDIFDKEI